MKKLFANLRTACAVITGRFTFIELKNNEVIVMPSKLSRADVKRVATAFFKEAYNLQ